MLDRTFLDVAASGGAPRQVPAGTESALLAEVEGDDRESAETAAHVIEEIFGQAGATTVRVEVFTADPDAFIARAVAAGTVERGVAVCGSGVGASVCANKIPGVRAGLVHDHYSARQGVEDDHMNIICMGARTIGPFAAWDLVETFLGAEFSQAERHLRRLGKVVSLEPEVISDRRGAGTTPRKT